TRSCSPAHRTATSLTYTLSLHDALPICSPELVVKVERIPEGALHDPAQMMDLRRSMERQIDAQVGRMPEARYRATVRPRLAQALDRKSTRLNSSHLGSSYAVFCLKENRR